MDKFLTKQDKINLSKQVRAETLEPCYKQLGKKGAQPLYNRPTFTEVRTIARLINMEGSQLGLLVGADGRKARRWQSDTGESPTYSQWTMLCVYAAKIINADPAVWFACDELQESSE